MPAHITRVDLYNTSQFLENGFRTPEAPGAKGGHLGLNPNRDLFVAHMTNILKWLPFDESRPEKHEQGRDKVGAIPANLRAGNLVK
jgi:hypothetical protein